jgi:lipopolysaccharide assembly protein A
MRVVYFLFLMVLLIAVGIFAVQNHGPVTLRYLDRSLSTTMALMIAAVYALGMLTGWAVIGFVRRSVRRVSEVPVRRYE